MAQHPTIIDGNKPHPPEAEGDAHKPAKHIEETARLASGVEKDKDPAKVHRAKD